MKIQRSQLHSCKFPVLSRMLDLSSTPTPAMLARRSPNGFVCLSCRQQLIHRYLLFHGRTRFFNSSARRSHDTHTVSPSFSNYLNSKPRPNAFAYNPQNPCRTRFAPSPTGHLHLGSLRTALYNYLLARRTGGQFILRIEDTDTKRTVPGAEARILEDLEWAGIRWDEGPDIHGPYGPYRQTERLDLYREAAEELIATEKAYRCFCSPRTLKEKAQGRMQGTTFAGSEGYDRTCYHLSKEGSERFAAEGRPYVVRLKEPEVMAEGNDLTFGRIRLKNSKRFKGLWQDPILLKSNGLPTYHLANVVDDHYMKITHVIRGAEWFISTKWHLELYRAFGWEPPVFAHVGLLLDEEGQKLSKREKSFDLGKMREEGVLPEALCNFLALMGWSHGRSRDFLPMKKMEEIFHLKFTKNNPVVNLKKLRHLSQNHAQARAEDGGEKFDELVNLVMEAARAQYSAEDLSSVGLEKGEKLRDACRGLLKSNSKNFSSVKAFVESQPYFFSDRGEVVVHMNRTKVFQTVEEMAIDDAFIRKKSLEYLFPADGKNFFAGPVEELKAQLDALIESFVTKVISAPSAADVVTNEDARKIAHALVYSHLRGWIAWGSHGPSLHETMQLLGPNIARRRIENVKLVWNHPVVGEEESQREDISGEHPEKEPQSTVVKMNCRGQG